MLSDPLLPARYRSEEDFNRVVEELARQAHEDKTPPYRQHAFTTEEISWAILAAKPTERQRTDWDFTVSHLISTVILYLVACPTETRPTLQRCHELLSAPHELFNELLPHALLPSGEPHIALREQLRTSILNNAFVLDCAADAARQAIDAVRHRSATRP